MSLIAGVGGIFFRSPDPAALAAWYAEKFGLEVQNWGESWGCTFDAIDHRDGTTKTMIVWSIFPIGDSERARGVTFNYRVDDLAAVVATLRERGVEVTDIKADPYGAFAWTHDPDGNKLELWQPGE